MSAKTSIAISNKVISLTKDGLSEGIISERLGISKGTVRVIRKARWAELYSAKPSVVYEHFRKK